MKKSIKTEGKISQPSHYGKLDLAYPIKKEDQGDYWTWVIATDPKEIAPFTLKLKSEDGLLRFLLLKKRIKALIAEKNLFKRKWKQEAAMLAETTKELREAHATIRVFERIGEHKTLRESVEQS